MSKKSSIPVGHIGCRCYGCSLAGPHFVPRVWSCTAAHANERDIDGGSGYVAQSFGGTAGIVDIHLHFTGINGIEWDAVELPSQFMENW